MIDSLISGDYNESRFEARIINTATPPTAKRSVLPLAGRAAKGERRKDALRGSGERQRHQPRVRVQGEYPLRAGELCVRNAAQHGCGTACGRYRRYAAETTMQLFMAESHWAVWELYLTAYSLPRTMDVIQQMIKQKLEIVTGGIMRGRATCILLARCAGFWKRRSGCFKRRTRRFRRRSPLYSSLHSRTSRE